MPAVQVDHGGSSPGGLLKPYIMQADKHLAIDGAQIAPMMRVHMDSTQRIGCAPAGEPLHRQGGMMPFAPEDLCQLATVILVSLELLQPDIG
jgi:hypothetical protein